MPSTVFQGLQTCLEQPRLVEQPPLYLRLVPPKPHLFKPTDQEPAVEPPTRKCSDSQGDHPEDFGAFSSITSLANASSQMKSDFLLQSPLPLRRTCSLLSEKSLELCTENLGSETGTDITESSCFPSPSSSCSSPSSQLSESSKICQETRKPISKISRREKCGAFPPPLTSIAGGSCIHVKPHREEGRLVLKAITSPAPRTYFQAERSHGRLRLRFLYRSCSSLTAHSEPEPEPEPEPPQEVEKEEEVVDPEESAEEEEEEVEEQEEKGEEEDTAAAKGSMGCLDRCRNMESLKGNETGSGVEMGIGKFQRPSNRRCHERDHGNKGMLSLELFCVASS